mgnify:FL=1
MNVFTKKHIKTISESIKKIQIMGSNFVRINKNKMITILPNKINYFKYYLYETEFKLLKYLPNSLIEINTKNYNDFNIDNLVNSLKQIVFKEFQQNKCNKKIKKIPYKTRYFLINKILNQKELKLLSKIASISMIKPISPSGSPKYPIYTYITNKKIIR